MGGSSENVPATPVASTINDLYGGQGQYDFFSRLRSEGLGGDYKNAVMDSLFRNLSGNTRAGAQRISEMAGQGATLGNRLGAIANLYQGNAGAMQNMRNDLTKQDFNAKLQGASGVNSIWGAMNARDLTNLQRYGLDLKRYEIDEGNDFNWGSVLSSLLQAGASLGGSAIMASDRKWKTNIKKIGEIKGVNIYNYNINGRNENGVIAQEIQGIIPNAVIKRADGLYVDYNKVIQYIGG